MKLLTLDGSYMWVHFVLLSILYMLKIFHNKLRVSQNLKLWLCWFKHSMWIWRIGNVHQLGRQNTQIPPHLVYAEKVDWPIFRDIDKSQKPNMEQNKWYTRAYTLRFHLYKLQNTKIRGLKVWIVVLLLGRSSYMNSYSQAAIYCTGRFNLWHFFELYTNNLCISLYTCYISIKRF